MKSERKSIENEYCRIACYRFCSSVGEIFRYTSAHVSSETDDVCGFGEWREREKVWRASLRS